MNISATNTTKLLNLVAQHLSSRQECRQLTYHMVISRKVDDGSRLEFDLYPNTSVFPDRYHRKSSDRENLLTHILQRHFDETSRTSDNFVVGEYKYILSFKGKRRRWTRIK